MTINYKIVDLFSLVDQLGDKPKIILHVCNDQGAWGAGFVVPLAENFPETKIAYHEQQKLVLGTVQFVDCCSTQENTFVANMIAQTLGWSQGRPPIRYESLLHCLEEVELFVSKNKGMQIIAPRFGAGLAGGKWEMIESLINKTLSNYEITICDLPSR
jgi:hypothetical protein